MAQNPSADRPSVRQFVRSRLRWQLWLLLFAAICAIVLSLTVLISRMMQRYARGTVIATSENLVYQGAQNLENYLHNVETLLLVPYSNSALYQRLSTDSAPGYELDSYVNLTLKASAVSDPTIYTRTASMPAIWCAPPCFPKAMWMLRRSSSSSGLILCTRAPTTASVLSSVSSRRMLSHCTARFGACRRIHISARSISI
mgnify:CR=1 FL=1